MYFSKKPVYLLLMSIIAILATAQTPAVSSIVEKEGLYFTDATQTKLYTGQWDSVLELKSTLLFSAAINPFSMVYNFYDDSLYAAAARGSSWGR